MQVGQQQLTLQDQDISDTKRFSKEVSTSTVNFDKIEPNMIWMPLLPKITHVQS